MENLIFAVHIAVGLAIIGLILIQQGKGADMGASFGGGASQTLFGSGGSGNFFSKMTAALATLFFVTSFSLAIIAKKQTEVGDDFSIPTMEKSDIPVLEKPADIPMLESVESDLPSVDEEAVQDIKSVESAPVPDDKAAPSSSESTQ